ncbi:N5-carboxyaminoimidazole ribonucleotide synthase [Thalictrum thalictroides]|uniref:N5-carboxyaminoimidazole ribonucleotide synthase n=1 Tax=Thalictrum thalictroides TaxID=46969 RepID=A0A7J6V7A7_THATH|nr:N5-carboxyaminoimidazole ribonucleotide synthase [Thalictrum thalictroides]
MLLRCPSSAFCGHHPCDSIFGSGFKAPKTVEFTFPMEHITKGKNESRSSSLHIRKQISCCQSSSIHHEDLSRKDELLVHGASDTIVGVLGGGQLGRMLCQAASQMAIKVMILDPLEPCPASALSYLHVGVLTVEIEHVDVATLEKLEQHGVDCQPKASTIRIIQDKHLQKVHFSRHGIPLPDFLEIANFDTAKRAGDLFGYPLMIKSKRLAYDGRGNAVAHNEEEISSSVAVLGGYGHGLYVEMWAPFIKELAVIVARGRDNSISCYPVVETVTGKIDNICHIVKAPADVPWKIRNLATDVAKKAVNSLDGAGVFAVELFLTKDGQVVILFCIFLIHGNGCRPPLRDPK